MKIRLLTLMAALLLIGFSGCKKAVDETNPSLGTTKSLADGTLCGSTTYTLWAGQTNNWGNLIVSNDDVNLYVTYNSTNGTFGTLHLWVGTDLTLLPMAGNPGNPIPGEFPYKFDSTGLTKYTFTIPLSTISFYTKCGDAIYVYAHADMGSETAWGGDIFKTPGKGKWYYSAKYITACCTTPPPDNGNVRLGTAFAKGDWVFTTDKKSNPENLSSLKLTTNRWGWANNMLAAGSITKDLWVGAGLNYTSKALNVGTATIVWDGTAATITYTLKLPYTFEEFHAYAGDLKPTTLAPGQYGNTAYLDPQLATSNTFTFSNIPLVDTNGDGAWFIVHAVVYGPGVTNP